MVASEEHRHHHHHVFIPVVWRESPGGHQNKRCLRSSVFACLCFGACFISAGLPPAALTPQPLHPWGDNYLLVMDKVEVPAVEVVRPGH